MGQFNLIEIWCANMDHKSSVRVCLWLEPGEFQRAGSIQLGEEEAEGGFF